LDIIWKQSYAIPLHKAGLKNNISNYSDISKFCAIPKLFEAFMATHLFFVIKNIISPFQDSFFTGWSPSTNN